MTTNTNQIAQLRRIADSLEANEEDTPGFVLVAIEDMENELHVSLECAVHIHGIHEHLHLMRGLGDVQKRLMKNIVGDESEEEAA